MLELRREGNSWYLDIIFYQGEQKTFDLNSLTDAYAVMGLSLAGKGENLDRLQMPVVDKDSDILTAVWSLPEDRQNRLTMNSSPKPYSEIQAVSAANPIATD